jgi:hypothetical protein
VKLLGSRDLCAGAERSDAAIGAIACDVCAVIERFLLSLKEEFLRRIYVPASRAAMTAGLGCRRPRSAHDLTVVIGPAHIAVHAPTKVGAPMSFLLTSSPRPGILRIGRSTSGGRGWVA